MGENIANESTDKWVISKIYKNSCSSIKQTKPSPVRKWVKDLKKHLSKEDKQMAKKPMMKCSPSLIIREMQVIQCLLIKESNPFIFKVVNDTYAFFFCIQNCVFFSWSDTILLISDEVNSNKFQWLLAEVTTFYI